MTDFKMLQEYKEKLEDIIEYIENPKRITMTVATSL